MRVFVTGGTGVLGRRAVPALLDAGHDVTVLARSASNVDAIEQTGARPARTDLFDESSVRRVVTGHDAVVNLATAIPDASRMLSARAWAANDRIRTEGSRILADAAIAGGVPRLVQESITFLYADHGDGWIEEDAEVAPVRFTRSALDAESQADRLAGAGGAGVVLRFGQFVAPDSSHMADLVEMAQRGWWPMVGPADAFASYIHADDAAAAVVSALDLPSGTFNVVDDDPLSREQHARVVSEVVGRHVRRPPRWIGRLPRVSSQARSQRVSNSRLRAASNWAPRCATMHDGWPSLFEAIGREVHHVG